MTNNEGCSLTREEMMAIFEILQNAKAEIQVCVDVSVKRYKCDPSIAWIGLGTMCFHMAFGYDVHETAGAISALVREIPLRTMKIADIGLILTDDGTSEEFMKKLIKVREKAAEHKKNVFERFAEEAMGALGKALNEKEDNTP